MRHDEERRGRLAQERLDGLARRDVEVVRGLVEQQQVRRLDAEQRELQPRPLAARQRADLLERVVAAEQEAGEVARAPRRRVTGIASSSASSTVVPGIAAPRSWAR